MWVWFQKGGIIMYIILFCSIVALAIFIERLWQIHRARMNTEKFMAEIGSTLRQNRIKDAIDICSNARGAVANILKAGILKHDRPKSEIKEAIEEAGVYEVPELEKNISALATIAHVTPLLGLLGTVLGMVRAFQVIQEKGAVVNPGDLAGGIWEALITTVAGLSVAIPTFVAYNFLVSRVGRIILDMEKSSTDLVNILAQRQK
jgi:biopolymer transport protein ExbB